MKRSVVVTGVLALLAIGVASLPTSAITSQAFLKSEIERTAVLYFLEQSHPVSGLTRDNANNFGETPEWNRTASIASTGFSLAVIANASMRGNVDPAVAEDYVLRTLKFSRDHVGRHKGWFYHFIDWETGVRLRQTEYSTIDTALFMAGALYAAEIFKNNAEIHQISRELYNDLDFHDYMTDGGAKPNKRTISMAYTYENGYTPGQWDMFAEQKILLLLGLGHPTKPIPPEVWLNWSRSLHALPNGESVMGIEAALFIHQYSMAFVDFRNFQDGFKNYHENSRLMSEVHRDLGQTDKRFKTLREGFWGFSAGDAKPGYRVWDALNYQGTVCIGCTLASTMYNPNYLADFVGWFDSVYRNQIWGRYGFSDSIDLDQNWFSSMVLGITAGPAYMAMANLEPDTSIWKDFMNIPEIKIGLERASKAGQGLVMQQKEGARVAQ